MIDVVFFYGTLMRGFDRPGRVRLDHQLIPIGHGWIRGALYDLGIYPAAIPAEEGRVVGEVHRMRDPETVLRALDEIEGYSADEPDTSLYIRAESLATLDDGTTRMAWVYFYNAPLGRAERVVSGNYLEHLKVR